MAEKSSIKIKERLLAAASDVFAEKGYRDATIAEICKRATANISSVSYYFGSKEAIYRDAWRHSFARTIEAHPPDGGVSAEAPPEERLRGQVRAIMARIADEKNRDFIISQMEMTNPTGLLQEVMASELTPLRKKTEGLVRELLGPFALDIHVHFCEITIVSMCINPMLMKRVKHGIDDSKGLSRAMDDMDAFADHVVKFALAGITAIRTQAKKDEKNDIR